MAEDRWNLDGTNSFTPNEAWILRLLAEKVPLGRIAEEMSVSRHTVRSHVNNIVFKLQMWIDHT